MGSPTHYRPAVTRERAKNEALAKAGGKRKSPSKSDRAWIRKYANRFASVESNDLLDRVTADGLEPRDLQIIGAALHSAAVAAYANGEWEADDFLTWSLKWLETMRRMADSDRATREPDKGPAKHWHIHFQAPADSGPGDMLQLAAQ